MFETLGRSYRLAIESLRLLRKDPELMLFPVISFIASVVVAGILGGLGIVTGGIGGGRLTGSGVLFIFLFYFGAYFVTIYFQVGLVASVQYRLVGGNPNLAYGIRAANHRLGPIFSWAIIAALVGLLLRILEEVARRNTSGLGRIVAGIIIGLAGMAWSLATFFVIPILAAEGISGFDVVKHSASIVKRRWGEAVVGQAGIGLIMIIIAVVLAVVLGGIGLIALGGGSSVAVGIGITFVALAVLGVLLIVAASAALQSIYTTVLYQYATTGQTGEEFSRDLLEGAFRPGRTLQAG